MATRKTAATPVPTAAPAEPAPAPRKPAKPLAFKVPKTLGACADLLYETRNQRLAIQKQADELSAREQALKEHIINTLPKSEASGVAGKLARVAVITDEIVQVKDWDAFYKYLKRTGSFHLMGKTLKQEAVRELLDAGKQVAGVGKFSIVKVSLNKV